MKPTIKNNLTNLFIKVYEPVIIRVEKFRATQAWRRGVKECERRAKEIVGAQHSGGEHAFNLYGMVER